MIEVKFYDNVDDRLLKFAVIISKSNGQWVFCKHKDRNTYEVPGGHREKGELILDTAKRELKEETGLDIVEIIPGLGRDKVYLSPGMTDESVNLVYCTCDGELSKDGLEEDEDLEPLLISKEEAKAILQSDSKIDIKCLMVLQSFININIDI